MIHVYAFDPGKTTGWAHISVNGDGLSLFRSGQADHFEIGDMFQNFQVHHNAVVSPDIEIIFVSETYQFTPGKSPAPWSLETIGLIRYWANYYNIPLMEQMPSEAKSLITNEVLKRAELWTPGQQHACDAARHALYYLIKDRKMLTECLIP